MDSPPAASSSFALRGRPSAITLEADGLRHPNGARRGGETYTAYEDVTHVSTSQRALWIGTRGSVYVIGRRPFVDPDGPENLIRALLERIAARPGGSAQLARMAEIEQIAHNPGALHATKGLLLLCTVGYALQVLVGDDVHNVGYFSGVLALDGDWWRVVTANLLHGFLLHLLLNLLGLFAIGSLVERALGSSRTVCVMAISAAGSMAASGLATPIPVVGVSGIVFGLLGALFWLEFRFPELLPAWWRVPRRGLYWMLGISALLSLLPFIAGAAHAGGFVAGGIAAAWLAWDSLGNRRPSPAWVRATAGAALAVTVAAVGAASFELTRPGEFAARYIARLGRLPDITAEELNNAAWMIAVAPGSSRELLESALELAERAVAETDREETHILDTLAEVYFQLGDRDAALAAIEEAIARSPDDDYYQEQRRRFLGERAPEDRPFFDPERESEGHAPATGLSV